MTGLNRHIKTSLALLLLTGLTACSPYNYPYAHRIPEEIPAQVCSGNNDTDRDGVIDCNDMCPNTAPGKSVGPDGCPLPEPPMEPKPFRG